MIKKIRIRNAKGFKDATFSFKPKKDCAKIVSIYGLEMSGKTAFMECLQDISYFIEGYPFWEKNALPYYPNLSKKVNLKRDTIYEIEFCAGAMEIQYKICFNANRITSERFTLNGVLVFERIFSENENAYSFLKKLEVRSNKIVEAQDNTHSSYLSACLYYHFDYSCEKVRDIMKTSTYFLDKEINVSQFSINDTHGLNEFLANCGLNCKVESKNRVLYANIEDRLVPIEKCGTSLMKAVSLFVEIKNATTAGRIVAIDSLNFSENIVTAILKMFAAGNGQIIFTTNKKLDFQQLLTINL